MSFKSALVFFLKSLYLRAANTVKRHTFKDGADKMALNIRREEEEEEINIKKNE